MKVYLIIISLFIAAMSSLAQNVDYSVVSVNEESELNLMCISADNDYVCMPIVKRGSHGVSWLSNRIIGISKDGGNIAYISFRNNSTNVYIKDLGKQGTSVQRTKRSKVLDFSYSPDGQYITFSEGLGKSNQIFVTDANKGYVCRQITNGNLDYSPVYSADMKQIFFARQEANGISIWSHDEANNFLSSCSSGLNPWPLKGENAILCSRLTNEGRSEIWKINFESGSEECIVSDTERSFTSPSVSPDGMWILCTGTGKAYNGAKAYYNTDIYICKMDGSSLTQLTYHAADDLSPIWSNDGRYIYFISQRGSATGTANIWRMDFIY